MKHLIINPFKTLLAILVLSIFGVSQSSAQQAYVWEEYGISFSLADDFAEVTNNQEEFSATGDAMEFAIIPFKDASVSDSDITTFTIGIANSLDLEGVDDVNTIQLNDFQGGYVEGVKDGVKIFLLGLIDPNSETNFFVIITFINEDENAIDEAIAICESLNKL